MRAGTQSFGHLFAQFTPHPARPRPSLQSTLPRAALSHKRRDESNGAEAAERDIFDFNKLIDSVFGAFAANP